MKNIVFDLFSLLKNVMLMKYALGSIHLVITQRGGGGLGYLMDLFDVKGGEGVKSWLNFCIIIKWMPMGKAQTVSNMIEIVILLSEEGEDDWY